MQDFKAHNHAPQLRFSILLVGAYSLAAQVLLFRALYVIFSGSELLLGFILSAWLVWVSFGSGVLGRLRGPGGGRSLEGALFLSSIMLVVTLVILRVIAPLLLDVPGELATLGRMAAVAAAVTLPCGMLSGYLFSFASKTLSKRDAASYVSGGTVYVWEAWGSGISGIGLGLVLFSLLGTFLSSVFFLALTFSFMLLRKTPSDVVSHFRRSLWLLPLMIFFLALPLAKQLDNYLESFRFKGFSLQSFTDTPYGIVSVIEREGQSTLVINGVPAVTVPDRARAEEKIHFPLLLHPSPRTLLLLGGGMGDVAGELSQHPLERITYVELDGEAVEAAGSVGLFRKTPGMKVIIDDARAFLSRDSTKYDVIILGVGEPLSLQLNKYYTKEFFLTAESRLEPGGIFALSLPGSENFFLRTQERFLGCINLTLESVFPYVLFLPGGNCHFMAFKDPFAAAAPGDLVDHLIKSHIEVMHIRPTTLAFRFSESRMAVCKQVIQPAQDIVENRDFHFSGYVYNLIHWNERLGVKLPERLVLTTGARNKLFLAACLGFIAAYLLFLFSLPGKRRSRISLTSVIIAGMCAMGGSIALLIAFQIICGALYQWIAILAGAFMAGAGLGSAWMMKRHGARAGDVPGASATGAAGSNRIHSQAREQHQTLPLAAVHLSLFVLLVLFAGFLLLCQAKGAPFWGLKPLFLVFNGLAGLLTGAAYVNACRVMGEGEEVAPILYSLDIVGGVLGASVFAVILLPLVGLYFGVFFLAAINGVAAVAVAIGGRRLA